MRAVMTLGKLVSLEVVDPDTGRQRTIRGKDRWLASGRGGKSLYICTVTKKNSSRAVPSTVGKAHRKFHGKTGNEKAWEGDCPSPSGKLTRVGLVKAVTYSVPKTIKSPEKNPYHWRHAFGDTGHATGKREPEYPPKYYPYLYKDQKGNLFIRRRKGNIFRVTDWIIG